jgi:serine protease AprX
VGLALALVSTPLWASPALANRPAAARVGHEAVATSWLTDVRSALGADATGLTGAGVDVAVIDSGITPVAGLDAPGKVLRGPDLSFDASDPRLRDLDALGHGTHLAGIMAGPDGVAPDARLVSVKVGAANGAVDVSQVIAAVDWVVEHKDDAGLHVRVLNLSIGFDTAQPASVDPLAYAVDRAWRAGIVVVVAAGNDAKTDRRLSSPASNPNVIAVGAADLHGSSRATDADVADFSASGSQVRPPDFVAPGAHIASLRVPGSVLDVLYPGARLGDDAFRGSGTSQAAAVVSGAAALLLEQRPDLQPEQVKALLAGTANKLPGGYKVGGAGLIDVGAAAAARTPTKTAPLVTMLGTGSIEDTRGLQHVALDQQVLSGDVDVSGNAFDSAVWRAALLAGGSWSGGSWSGGSWSGGSWSGGSWSGGSWSGGSWSGGSWDASSWDASSWNGGSWSGGSWSGGSWSGGSWSASSWG